MPRAVVEMDEETEKHMRAEREAEARADVEPEVEAPQEEEEKEVKQDRPRGPDGKFAPKVEAKEGVKEPEKQEAKPEKPEKDRVPEGYVAHGAFHEERERRKALQRQVEQMESRWSDLVKKMQEKPAQIPDPSQDFAGHTLSRLQAVDQTVGQVAQKVQGFEQWQQQQAQEAQFMASYSHAAAQFASQKPDFDQAYKHWLMSRYEELTDAGYTQQQALHIRTAEERGIVAKAFEDGVNPAERLYAVAKRRGYTTPSGDPKPEPKPEINPAEEKLERIERGQKATPQMSGGGVKPKLTLGAIAAMSDSEFAALDWEKTMRELTP